MAIIHSINTVKCALLGSIAAGLCAFLACIPVAIHRFVVDMGKGEEVFETLVDCLKYFVAPLITYPSAFVLLAICCAVYNWLSRKFGGIEVYLVDENQNH